jgi:hypothetical protein
MSSPGTILPIKALIVFAVFSFLVFSFQAALYNEEFTPASPVTPDNGIFGGIPILSQIEQAIKWVAGGITFLWNMFTFNVPEIPDVIRGFFIIINVVAAILGFFVILELILKIASIIRG